ncbi:MAG TPA: hypothetical protein VHB45_09780 [Alloacidobacterium sp.]|nr:hypothetical protein [Alloacidobacterium sp.]
MARIFTIAVALICIVCVLALCIAPSVDIPQTVLKSLQIIALLMFTLIASAYLVAAVLRLATFLQQANLGASWEPSPQSPLTPLQVSCVQQC